MILTQEIKEHYLKLKQLLKQQQWQNADLQTRILMLKITGSDQRQDILLTKDDFNNFPCAHLKLINDLWLQYTQNHFGFTITKNIYLDCNRDYKLLAEKVGWQTNNNWINFQNINFTLEAPSGHLPLTWVVPPTFSIYWSARFASAGWGLLLKRIEQCNF